MISERKMVSEPMVIPRASRERPEDFKVKIKEEVRAQTDEPTAAHTREKERKKANKNDRSTSLRSWSTSMLWGDALVAGTRARRGIAFRDTSPVSGVAT